MFDFDVVTGPSSLTRPPSKAEPPRPGGTAGKPRGAEGASPRMRDAEAAEPREQAI